MLKYIVNFAIFPGNNIAYKKQIEIELYSCILALQIQNLRVLRDSIKDMEVGEMVKRYIYKLKHIKIELNIFTDVLKSSGPVGSTGEILLQRVSCTIDTLQNAFFVEKSTGVKRSLWDLMDDSQSLLTICNIIRE